jgi:hypothetical protein
VVADLVLDRRDKLSLIPFFRRGLAVYDRPLLIKALVSLHPVLRQQPGASEVQGLVEGFLADRPVPLLQLWFMICLNTWLNEPSGASLRQGAAGHESAQGASI